MQYFEFRWSEEDWDGQERPERGGSWWFYEFGPDGFMKRMIVVYDDGLRVRYGPDHQADEYGELLPDVHLGDVDPAWNQPINAEEFERLWQTGPWANE